MIGSTGRETDRQAGGGSEQQAELNVNASSRFND